MTLMSTPSSLALPVHWRRSIAPRFALPPKPLSSKYRAQARVLSIAS
jgi:hypothetical protein